MRVARVVPDVSGLEAEFDYLIPERFDEHVHVGTIVRVVLQGRRVRGWVVNDDSTPPEGVRLLEIQKVTGAGPFPELLDLAEWAAWRWAGKRSFFLQAASPHRVVPAFVPPSPRAGPGQVSRVIRLAPNASMLERVLNTPRPALLIVPQTRSAENWARRLRAEGLRVASYPDQWQEAARGRADYVVGTRLAAWASMSELASIVILDAHDEGLQSKASPTWSAVEVATERARRLSVPCTLISSVPRLEQLQGRELITGSRQEERSGWAPLHIVDLRHTDPRTGLFSPALVELLRTDKRVIGVVNRKGRAQLLVCASCDEIARCEQCQGPLRSQETELLCMRCASTQPVVCRACGSSNFKHLRPGVSRLREDLESLALRPVGEVTSDNDELPDASVLIGTEAVLHRVGRADAVAFLDFDQELLAPRFRAPEDALVLLSRAARIVGGHQRGGLVLVQTRQPQHEVIEAALHGDPDRLTEIERLRRAEMGWPPFRAIARVSGTQADAYVAALEGVEALGPRDGAWLVRAAGHEALCDAFAKVPRPSGGTLRVEIDPARV